MAVGSHDDHLYIYEINSETHEYKLYAKGASHSSKIDALDWSLDSKHIRSSDGAHETHYFNVETKHHDPHGSEHVAEV